MNDANDETRYQLIRLIEENPNISQRELADRLGISLGKVNYCLRALIGVGLIKVGNFTRSKNKGGYVYILTPAGIRERVALTVRFLEQKQQQYDRLKKEIDRLKLEVGR